MIKVRKVSKKVILKRGREKLCSSPRETRKIKENGLQNMTYVLKNYSVYIKDHPHFLH